MSTVLTVVQSSIPIFFLNVDCHQNETVLSKRKIINKKFISQNHQKLIYLENLSVFSEDYKYSYNQVGVCLY